MYKYNAFIESRSLGFFGPDVSVCVQCVPHGVQRLKTLNKSTAKKRGIILIDCGKGYSKNMQTDKSMLCVAYNKAEFILQKVNAEEVNPSLYEV